jgi:Uma2 family endonuclease
MDTVATHYVSREEFREWSERQPRGRYERVNGKIVPMNAGRSIHALVKARIWRTLDEALRRSGIEGTAYPDGFTVEVGEHTDYEPDALVNLGPLVHPDVMAAPNPVIVVEVLSPGTRSIDTTEKLAGYLRVNSIQHYLVVGVRAREVVHHRRQGEAFVSTVVREGAITLDPPGLTVTLDAMYDGSGL